MILQAYVNDSGSDLQGPLYVLAGFLSSAERWADFSTEWAVALAGPPGLAYFNAAEANRLKGEFDRRKGWDGPKRDDRVATLIRIIKRHALGRIHTSVRPVDFETYIKGLPLPSRRLTSDNPYTLLSMQIILSNAVWMASNSGALHNLHGSVDFIFDNQVGFSDETLQWWPNFKQLLDESGRTNLPLYVGSAPIFRDEKEFLPLQAADLYAWHLRRHFANNQALWVPTRWELRQLNGMPGVGRNLMPRELRVVRDHLLTIGKQFEMENPGVQFFTSEQWASRKKHGQRRVKTTSRPSSDALGDSEKGE